MMRAYNVSGIPIVDDDGAVLHFTGATEKNGERPNRPKSNGKPPRLLGILTRRDLKFQEDDNRRIGDVMTKENLVTAPEDTTLDDAERILGRPDTQLEYAEMSEILHEGMSVYLQRIQTQVADAALAVQKAYFLH